MKQLNEAKKIRDVVLWLIVLLLTVAAVGTNYYIDFSGPSRTLLWLVWLVLSLAVGFFSSQGNYFFLFAKDAKIELQKVVWPTRPETIQTTGIVMAMVAITGLVLWFIDTGMTWVIGKITQLG